MKRNYNYDPLMQPALDYEMRQRMKQSIKKLWSMRGAIKVWGDVARYYLTLAQFILIGIAFFKYMEYETHIIILLTVIFVVLMIIVVFFHVRYIMPEEYDYMNRRDRVKMQTLENTKK